MNGTRACCLSFSLLITVNKKGGFLELPFGVAPPPGVPRLRVAFWC